MIVSFDLGERRIYGDGRAVWVRPDSRISARARPCDRNYDWTGARLYVQIPSRVTSATDRKMAVPDEWLPRRDALAPKSFQISRTLRKTSRGTAGAGEERVETYIECAWCHDTWPVSQDGNQSANIPAHDYGPGAVGQCRGSGTTDIIRQQTPIRGPIAEETGTCEHCEREVQLVSRNSRVVVASHRRRTLYDPHDWVHCLGSHRPPLESQEQKPFIIENWGHGIPIYDRDIRRDTNGFWATCSLCGISFGRLGTRGGLESVAEIPVHGMGREEICAGSGMSQRIEGHP